MPEQSTRRFRLTIKEEIDGWQQEGLISNELAGMLSSRYPLTSHSNRAITIALILGSVLLGLGVILFVGSNWESMSRLLKVSIIVSSIIASYAAGWRFKFEPGNRPKLGSALLLLGTLLYGAGIWLVSQIFNFDASLSNGLFLWALGTSAMALASKSGPLTVFSAILISAWNLSQTSNDYTISHFDPLGNIWTFLPSMLLGAGLCAQTRSRASLYVLLAGGSIWTTVLSGASWVGLLIYGTLLYVCYLILRRKWDLLASPFLYVGVSAGLTACLAATFDRSAAADSITSITNTVLLLAATLFAAMYAGIKDENKENHAELVSLVGLAVGGALIAQFCSGAPKLLASNLILLTLIAGIIAAGIRLQKTALINIAIAFAVLDIICRYFDMFFSMMDRSLFFMMGGLILILAGSFAEKKRRALMGSFS